MLWPQLFLNVSFVSLHCCLTAKGSGRLPTCYLSESAPHQKEIHVAVRYVLFFTPFV